jgi:hypothetical protein
MIISGIFSALTAGTYTVKVADASSCSATTIVQITEPSMVVFSSINSVIPTCSPGSDGKLIINAIGGIPPYTYQLNAGFSQTNNTFSGLNNGNYIVTIKDANNCTKTSLYNLANPNLPSVTSVNVNQVTCAGNNNGSITTIVAGGTAPINYTINPGGLNNTTGIFDSLPINNYIVSIVDANNCTKKGCGCIFKELSRCSSDEHFKTDEWEKVSGANFHGIIPDIFKNALLSKIPSMTEEEKKYR